MIEPKELLRASVWARELDATTLRHVADDIEVKPVPAGEAFIQRGDTLPFWHGVVEGVAKVSTLSPEGKPVTFTGVPVGGWFGEGSVLKREARQYDAVALRASRIALMPEATFDWLVETSLAFNRALIRQLNERLGVFIATVEYERLLTPESRVARALAGMFNAVLYPDSGPVVQLSQEEIGYLVGVSRQRVNQALQVLEAEGLLGTDYGGITVRDLDRLRTRAP
ncbi:Crp/Fnr family transcriptional regulator [soil metagenome]